MGTTLSSISVSNLACVVCYSWKPWSGVLSEKAIVRGVIGIWDNHPVSVEGSHHVSLSEYAWNQPPSLRCDEGIAVSYLDSASEFNSLFAPFDIAEIQKGWRELPSGQSLQFSPRVPATICFPAEKQPGKRHCGADWIPVEAPVLVTTEPLTQPSSPNAEEAYDGVSFLGSSF